MLISSTISTQSCGYYTARNTDCFSTPELFFRKNVGQKVDQMSWPQKDVCVSNMKKSPPPHGFPRSTPETKMRIDGLTDEHPRRRQNDLKSQRSYCNKFKCKILFPNIYPHQPPPNNYGISLIFKLDRAIGEHVP